MGGPMHDARQVCPEKEKLSQTVVPSYLHQFQELLFYPK